MKILDTNMILRFLLEDNEEMALIVKDIIDNNKVIITNEAVSEVVYVLSGVYKLERSVISNVLLKFISIDNIVPNDYLVLSKALTLFAENMNLDFMECLICASTIYHGYEVCTFDKRLDKLIGELSS